jgi:hypothetical protein
MRKHCAYNVLTLGLQHSCTTIATLSRPRALLHHLAGLLHQASLITWIALERPRAVDDLLITCVLQPLNLLPHVPNNLCKLLEVDVLLRAHEIPPDGRC